MKSKDRFQFVGVVDGFVHLIVLDQGHENVVKVTPRKLGSIVSQLLKIDDMNNRTVQMPLDQGSTLFKITKAEAQQLIAVIDKQMGWVRGS